MRKDNADLRETTIDLILDSVENVVETIDDKDQLNQFGTLIGNIFARREALLEAREANKKRRTHGKV